MTLQVAGIPDSKFPLRDLDVGESVGCAVARDGSVWCFGSNHEGQRGNGNRNEATFGTATSVSAFSPNSNDRLSANVRSVSVGNGHVCVSTPNGVNVWCWGKNNDGQSGAGNDVSHCTCPNEIRFGGQLHQCPQNCALGPQGPPGGGN